MKGKSSTTQQGNAAPGHHCGTTTAVHAEHAWVVYGDGHACAQWRVHGMHAHCATVPGAVYGACMALDCPRTHLRCALWLLAAVAATHDDHALRCLQRLTDAGAASWSRTAAQLSVCQGYQCSKCSCARAVALAAKLPGAVTPGCCGLSKRNRWRSVAACGLRESIGCVRCYIVTRPLNMPKQQSVTKKNVHSAACVCMAAHDSDI